VRREREERKGKGDGICTPRPSCPEGYWRKEGSRLLRRRSCTKRDIARQRKGERGEKRKKRNSLLESIPRVTEKKGNAKLN